MGAQITLLSVVGAAATQSFALAQIGGDVRAATAERQLR
jgi:hypothetical protein